MNKQALKLYKRRIAVIMNNNDISNKKKEELLFDIIVAEAITKEQFRKERDQLLIKMSKKK